MGIKLGSFVPKETTEPTISKATTDQLFTELMKRIQQKNPSHIYFVDQTTAPGYPTWSIYAPDENSDYIIEAKEIKE